MQTNKFFNAQVADFTEAAPSFSSADTITRVIGYLNDSKEYDAIVEDGDKVSIVSVRDLLNVENITTQKLSKLMKQVPKLSGKDSIFAAAKLMFDYRLGSLPVYDGKKLLGKISRRAIAKALVEVNHFDESIGRIATPNPVCVDATDSAAKAKRLMADRKISPLPILKEKRLSGVVTSESIAFRKLPPTDRGVKGDSRVGRLDMDVSSLSDPQITTNEVTDTIGETLENMLRAGSHYSVVVNDSEVQGIVTFRDFLKLLPSSKDVQVPISIVGLPDDPLQSEMAKKKFQSSATLLSKAMPDMTEARAVIKSGESKAPKKRYQVQVLINSPDQRHSYEVSSYDLAKAFEEIEAWIKKIASSRSNKDQKSKKRETRRKPALR